MVKKTKIVVFDLDGTLLCLPIDYKKLLKKFSEILKVNKKRPILEVISKTNKKTREKLFELWTNAELEAFPRFKTVSYTHLTLPTN